MTAQDAIDKLRKRGYEIIDVRYSRVSYHMEVVGRRSRLRFRWKWPFLSYGDWYKLIVADMPDRR